VTDTEDAKEETGSEKMARLKAELAERQRLENEEKLKAAGFVSSAIGIIFPGIDPNEIKTSDSNDEAKVVIPDPALDIGPCDTNGMLNLTFNQEMLYPPSINYRMYKSIFAISIIADTDGEEVYGRIIDKKDLLKKPPPAERILYEYAEEDDGEQVSGLRFNITIENHTATFVTF
jgi:hypothetical protein